MQSQLQSLAASIAHQQSVFVDIAGARTAELQSSLAHVQQVTADLRGETERLRQLQDAISHHLHDLVLDVVQPELRAQLGQGIPRLVAEALAPELGKALSTWLPQVVASQVSPEVRQLLSEWLPVMVADTVQPEVRQAIAERLPDMTAAAVQPEIRRVLSERLPQLVGDSVHPEVYRALVDRLPGVVSDAVTPEVRHVLANQLSQIVGDAVEPELRRAVDDVLPGALSQVVGPEVRRVLGEGLPYLVAETVQPEVRQFLGDHLPHLVSETVRPELRETLEARLPSVVAQVVTPEVRRTLAERLPYLVAETVQPELRQVLADRLPGIVAESVAPSVGALLSDRMPAMLADVVTPEMSVTLAEVESATGELRHEAAKLRGLREVIAERIPEALIAALEPQIQEVLLSRFPRLVSDLAEPVLRGIMTEQLPPLVAAAVQPDVAQSLGYQVPEMLAETVRPELRQLVAQAIEAQLPGVVADAVRPQLQQGLSAALPATVAQAVTPEVVTQVLARLPALVGEAVGADLSASLAEIEGSAAEMRAETARLRALREVVTDRLPAAVMSAVRAVLDESVSSDLPQLLAGVLEPAVREAVATPIPAALDRTLEPALRNALSGDLPEAIRQTVERQVDVGLSESLPALVANSTEPRVRAALAGVEQSVAGIDDLRRELLDRLSDLVHGAAAAPFAHFEASSGQLRAEAERLGTVREEILRKLPVLIEEALAVPLAEFESSAAQLRVEAERLRGLRQETASQLPRIVSETVTAALANQPIQPRSIVAAEVPGMVQDAVAQSLTDVETSAAALRSEAAELRGVRAQLARDLPRLVHDAVAAALAGAGSAALAAPQADEGEGWTEPAPEPEPEPAPWPDVEPPEPTAAAVSDVMPAVEVAPTAPPEAAATAEGWTDWMPAAEPPPPPAAEPRAQPAEPEPDAVSAGVEPAPLSFEDPVSDAAVAAEPALEEPPDDDSVAAALAPSPSNGSRTADVAASDDATLMACVLPGLVVGPTMAHGISAAVSRARLRRRRRRRAGPPAAGLHRRDPFATELTRRLEWFSLARGQGSNGAGAAPPSDPGVVPVGERDGNEVALPLGRLGAACLVGPRAREVARAAVLTLLAEHPPDRARAIVVGDLLPTATTFPGLGRARDVASVVSGLQAETVRRQALLAEAGVADLASYRSHRPDDPLPLVVVAAADMTAVDASRLRALLDDGAAVGIVGLVADTPLAGAVTIRLQGPARVGGVSPEGAVDDLVGARLFTVDREPAAELVGVVASARTDLDGDAAPPADEPFEAVSAPAAAISVTMLGAFRVDVQGREIRAGLRAKAKELLAFYLLHPEGASLEEATEALWPEADPRRGSEWFWTALGNLRSRLRSATENRELKVIEREGDRYRIEPLFEVDLWRFEAALAAASEKSGDPAWTESLEAAAALYKGELLAGADWPWADVPREDLRGRAVDVHVSLAATRLVAADVRGALDALERAVEIDPLAEQLYRRIMRLHAKLSRPDQADAAFRSLEARLGEFDLEPSPESTKLHQELCGAAES
jgi:DNA-binding SARP family transcriptional activator